MSFQQVCVRRKKLDETNFMWKENWIADINPDRASPSKVSKFPLKSIRYETGFE